MFVFPVDAIKKRRQYTRMTTNHPKVETKANNDSERSHTVILDGKELNKVKVVLFCAGNRTQTYTVVQLKKDGKWHRISPEGMRISQARSWISRLAYNQRNK
jgi:sRNA-binding protein